MILSLKSVLSRRWGGVGGGGGGRSDPSEGWMAQYHVILSLAKGGAWDGAPRQKEPSQDVQPPTQSRVGKNFPYYKLLGAYETCR